MRRIVSIVGFLGEPMENWEREFNNIGGRILAVFTTDRYILAVVEYDT